MKIAKKIDSFEDLDDWISPEEAWCYLKISRGSFYSLIRRGSIPYKRLGRLIRIPKESLNPMV